ncbi:protein kinase [Martelella sp. HB161492]|uniref:protein kinase domain-containing protein n=1 Tax=Martelella sp. HB161492 TaxID=2720726 RepID=UPI0015916C68|nr:protein kinase [Martelella sp. HB161492]
MILNRFQDIEIQKQNTPAAPNDHAAARATEVLVELAGRARNRGNVPARTGKTDNVLRLTSDNCKEIAEGGFGQVFRVVGTPYNNGNPVAIKVLHRNDAKTVVEMDREAAVGRSLDHSDNIVRIFGRTKVVLPGQEPASGAIEALVMEHVDGPTLSDLQDRAKYLYKKAIISHAEYWSTTQFLLRGVTKGLSDMAERNFVHADVKGQNAIYDRHSNTVKLIDLGSAVQTDQKDHHCYTAMYASPEQWKHWNFGHSMKPDENRKVDSFAVGQMTFVAGEGSERYFGIKDDRDFRSFMTQVLYKIKERDQHGPASHLPSILIDRKARKAKVKPNPDDINAANKAKEEPIPAGINAANTAYTEFVNNASAYKADQRMSPQELQGMDFLKDPLLSDDKVKDVIERIVTFANTEVKPLAKPIGARPKSAEPAIFEQMISGRKRQQLASIAREAANLARIRNAQRGEPSRNGSPQTPARSDSPQTPPRIWKETTV